MIQRPRTCLFGLLFGILVVSPVSAKPTNWAVADPYQATDLSDADLRGTRLVGADLRSADVRGANLFKAELTGAQLAGSDLRGARFLQPNQLLSADGWQDAWRDEELALDAPLPKVS